MTYQPQNFDRRSILQSGFGLGGIALSSLLQKESLNAASLVHDNYRLPVQRAKRVIYLFQCGGPSHIDLFDYHPAMRKIHGTELPDSIRNGQRLTGMTSRQSSFPCVAPMFEFKKYGQAGTYMSELLPYTSKMADEMTVIKTMNTEAVNHDPAITYINTGTQIVGHPSMGAWLSYGLGSVNQNLPSYVVLTSTGEGQTQALFSRLWGSGPLPSKHQGVKFRSGNESVLYLKNPPGLMAQQRRQMLDTLGQINQETYAKYKDQETLSRTAQYEMAYRMQTSVPESLNLENEKQETLDLYGPDVLKPKTFANNCIRARKLAEAGVPFIQVFHRSWDQHSNLPRDIRKQCEKTDQPSAGLLKDLKQRGLLEDTLVIWGGEFGRTIYSQGKLSETNHGRDHHGRCFTYWMAGGGVKKGFEYGETDDYSYNIVRDPVHINDFNATVLHLLGIDHEKLSVKHQGLDMRLTGVEKRRVIKEIFA